MIVICFNILNTKSYFIYAEEKKTNFIRHQISVDAGVHYNYYTNKIERKHKNGFPTPYYNGYSAAVYLPVLAGQGGLWYNFFISKKLLLKTGITYFNRIIKVERNRDTIIIYRRNPPKTVAMNEINSFHNIEIPLMVGIQLAKIQLSFGIRNNINLVERTEIESISNYKYTHSRRKKIDQFDYRNYHLNARINYSFKIKEQTLSIYCAS